MVLLFAGMSDRLLAPLHFIVCLVNILRAHPNYHFDIQQLCAKFMHACMEELPNDMDFEKDANPVRNKGATPVPGPDTLAAMIDTMSAQVDNGWVSQKYKPPAIHRMVEISLSFQERIMASLQELDRHDEILYNQAVSHWEHAEEMRRHGPFSLYACNK